MEQLVADVGGTRARFARLDDRGRPLSSIELPSRELADFPAALRAGAARLGVDLAGETEAAVAVAGPVTGDLVTLTNVGWRFSVAATRADLGLARFVVLNDFEALARSLPTLGAADLDELRAGVAAKPAPLALLGPGTGLGVSGLVAAGDRWVALRGEGGHRDLAATDEREWRIVAALAARFGRASAERALSGPGLVWLYEAICALDGRPPEAGEPHEVVARAAAGGCAAAAEATRLFSGWLGAVAGDLVLTLGARGGLYLGGGVLRRMGATFDRARFLARFEAKGRFADYLRPVPIRQIVSERAALAGAARALLESS